MAAEATVSFLIERLNLFLRDVKELGLTAVHLGACKLRDELQRMIKFIRTADAMTNRNESVRTWLEQTREIALSMEDLMDDFQLYVCHNPYLQKRHTVVTLLQKSHWTIRRQIYLYHLLGTQMQDIGDRVLKVSKQCPQEIIMAPDYGSSSSLIIPSCIEEADDPIGFDKARDMLVEWLLGGKPELTRITVSGLGGMGKTTLAKKVYDDCAIKTHFDCRVWISVSRRFRMHSILLRMMEQFYPAFEKAAGRWTHKELFKKVSNYLRDKRYLIVLDDIWTVGAWEGIKHVLPDSRCSSRVMITTCKADLTMSPCGLVCHVGLLSRKDAWHLFMKKAFPPNSVRPKELEDTAEKIVQRCGGWPLSIAVASGFLSSKQQSEWPNFLQSLSDKWESNYYFKILTRMIQLSFNDLPYYVKSCLLYFCLFPEDTAVQVKTLILLWTAEGFIKAGESKTVEEVAEDILSALISRSLVQASEFYEDGRLRTCRVHHLIRDLILAIAQEENFTVDSSEGDTRLHDRVRRIFLQDNFKLDINLTRFCNLRSFYISRAVSLPLNSIQTAIASFRLLKVLHLEGTSLKKFPTGVENLLLLKYLGLRHSQITGLPGSIGNLADLQTLDLTGSQIAALPKEILNLKHLRHLLVCHHVTRGVSVPKGMGALTSLQSLGCINAPEESAEVGELRNLINLRRLCIKKLKRGDGSSLFSSIKKMVELQSLKVMFNNEDQTLDLQTVSTPPAGLQRLHLKGRLARLPGWAESLQNLVKMSLSGSRLKDDPFEILKSLPKLVVLIFTGAYDGTELRCGASGFPSLRVLKLGELHRLEVVDVEEGAFPCLQVLQIWDCPKLKKVPLSIQVSIEPEETKKQLQEDRKVGEDDANLHNIQLHSAYEEAAHQDVI